MSDEVIVGFLVLVTGALVVTLVLAWRTRRFLARATRVGGTIVRVDRQLHTSQSYGGDHPSETTLYFTPVVVFSLPDGSRLQFRSGISDSEGHSYLEGQTVTVVYDAAHPSGTAEIEGPAVWRRVIHSGLVTFGLLAVTALGRACR